MPSIILVNSRSENPIIFFGSKSWKRVAEKDTLDGEGAWLARTPDRERVTDKKLAHLMEHVIRHPQEVDTIDEHPELGTDDTAAAEWINDRVAKLDAVIVRGIARRDDAKIEIGGALNEEKGMLGHGKFQRHFAETLGSLMSLRTAERYMKLARETEAASISDKLSIFKLASDEGARTVRTATEHAQAEQGDRKTQKRSALYKLHLALNTVEKKAVDTLRRSPDWPEAEHSIILELRRLCAKYRIHILQNQDDNHADNSVDA